jgi:ABC-type Mn2+/Zn2+ transport system permease subunit
METAYSSETLPSTYTTTCVTNQKVITGNIIFISKSDIEDILILVILRPVSDV